METDKINLKTKNYRPFSLIRILSVLFIFLAFFFLSNYLFSAPKNNTKYQTELIHLSSNDNLNSFVIELKNKNIIRSTFFLKVFVSLFKTKREMNKGDYLFNRKSSVFVVAWQLARGIHNVNPIKIMLREGLNNKEMADIFAKRMIDFPKNLFLEKVDGMQGYLFPDTYFFYRLDTVEEIITKLSNNFNNHIKKIDYLIKKSKKKLPEIIIMASIIQKEAKGKGDASIISGILWKRIKLGIPLQVDADKITYKIRGLPVKPIDNPGLVSIIASLKPTDSPYLYYLHDKNGNVHFAKTFKEHRKNIIRYLK